MTNSRLSTCPLCAGAVNKVDAMLPVSVGRRTIEVHGSFDKCSVCGEVYLAPGEMDKLMLAASAKVREECNLLRPDEVRTIRASLGLSQADFELLLGVGPKTVVRWEKGTVFQNGATDTLLKILRDVPAAAAYLLALRGTATAPGSVESATAAMPATTRYTYTVQSTVRSKRRTVGRLRIRATKTAATVIANSISLDDALLREAKVA